MHMVARAFSLAFARAGKSMAANMAMMAMTTSNSIRVKPLAVEARHLQRGFGIFGLDVFMCARFGIRFGGGAASCNENLAEVMIFVNGGKEKSE